MWNKVYKMYSELLHIGIYHRPVSVYLRLKTGSLYIILTYYTAVH